jgi:preprotein translocase subunit YajC
MTHLFLQAGGESALGGLLPFALLILVMYMFFFRPQMKRQKEEKKFQSDGLKKGMRIVTSSGIHAKILEVQETTLIIESENTRLKVDKTSLSKEQSAQYLPVEEKKDKSKDKNKSKDSEKDKDKKEIEKKD